MTDTMFCVRTCYLLASTGSFAPDMLQPCDSCFNMSGKLSGNILVGLVAWLMLPSLGLSSQSMDCATPGPFVAFGLYHTCAVQEGGNGICWGYNSNGQLGDGTVTARATPGYVLRLAGVKAIVAGWSYTCALNASALVSCWGDNSVGQIGDDTNISPRLTLVSVFGLSMVRAISGGVHHVCALALAPPCDPVVSCWGWNVYGELGDGSTVMSTKPVSVTGLHGVVRAIAAGGQHTCALLLRGDGDVISCWGDNSSGQLGNGTITRMSSVPVSVAWLTGVRAIALGNAHSCALLEGGAVSCWGWNERGQLGNNSTVNSANPVPVLGLTGVVAIAAGAAHTCALSSEAGTVSCWGDNMDGALGDGTYTNRLTPVHVSNLSGVVSINAGSDHTCATLREGHLLRCWGYNEHGEVTGDQSTNKVNVPSTPVLCGAGKEASTHTCWASYTSNLRH